MKKKKRSRKRLRRVDARLKAAGGMGSERGMTAKSECSNTQTQDKELIVSIVASMASSGNEGRQNYHHQTDEKLLFTKTRTTNR